MDHISPGGKPGKPRYITLRHFPFGVKTVRSFRTHYQDLKQGPKQGPMELKLQGFKSISRLSAFGARNRMS